MTREVVATARAVAKAQFVANRPQLGRAGQVEVIAWNRGLKLDTVALALDLPLYVECELLDALAANDPR